VEGYREKARAVTGTREKMMREIQAMEGMSTFGEPQLGLFSFGSDRVDIYAVWGKLVGRGWFSGLVRNPRAIHLMLSPAHAEVADEYLADLRAAVKEVEASGATAEGTQARYS
jgi:hypothetical protein